MSVLGHIESNLRTSAVNRLHQSLGAETLCAKNRTTILHATVKHERCLVQYYNPA